MEEHKDSDDFKNNATKAKREAYFVGFDDYKEKVVQVYPTLDLSAILKPREEEGEAKEDH